jgi:hypothetical protein
MVVNHRAEFLKSLKLPEERCEAISFFNNHGREYETNQEELKNTTMMGGAAEVASSEIE